MLWGILRSTVATLVVTASVGWTTAAWSANIWEKSFWMSGPRYSDKVPLCGEHGPLDMIIKQSGIKESRFWLSDLEILGFERIHEIAWEPWASGSIPRRFCEASVRATDGRWRQIYYSIAEDTGMIGANYGVEWCVVGLDRDWAYNPRCRWARP